MGVHTTLAFWSAALLRRFGNRGGMGAFRALKFDPIPVVAIAFISFHLLTPSSAHASSLEALDEPPRSVAEDAALLEKGRIHAQQKALVRLSMYTDPAADKVLLAQFEKYRAGQLSPELWLELFEAMAKRHDPEVKARLGEYQQEVKAAADTLENFRECLRGGDGESGRKIFTQKPEAGCVRCHSVEGKGGQIGPELTWLRHSVERLHILESIILPNATIADGYPTAMLKLKSGEDVVGVVTSENDTDMTVTDITNGKKRKVLVDDLVERTPLPSPMPPIFGQVLSKRDIRDLIEFLAEGD
jgi:putative heme-binding domain-containing protein